MGEGVKDFGYMPMESTARSRKWLILAHCFNMDGRAASQTITDRLSYMMAQGIVPVVISAPTGERDRRFPHYQVLSPAPSGILFEMRHIIRRRCTKRWLQITLKAMITLCCLPVYVLEKAFIHLDSQWSWFLTAFLWGWVIARKHRPELIYSTAGPPSTHAAGYILNRVLKIPWLVEIHDPLIYDSGQRRWHNYLFKRWLEKKAFSHAAAIIYFTEEALNSARRRHPTRSNLVVLRPGADPQYCSDADYRKGSRIHFGHFGSLAPDRNLAIVIKALHYLMEKEPILCERVRLDIYGAKLDPVSSKARNDFPLGSVLQEHGRLEFDPNTGKSGRQQVVEAMQRSDVLLLIHGIDTFASQYIPSKVYEYLMVGRPIIGLAGMDSELARILAANGHRVVDSDNWRELARVMASTIKTWEKDGLPDCAVERSFTVEDAVKKILTIASTIVQHRAEDGAEPQGTRGHVR